MGNFSKGDNPILSKKLLPEEEVPPGFHCIYLHWLDCNVGIVVFQGHSFSYVFVCMCLCMCVYYILLCFALNKLVDQCLSIKCN